MGVKAKFHGPAFAGLETSEQLSDEQIDARAGELFGQLTQDEKIKMMSGDPPFWLGMADMMGGGYADHPWVAGAVPRLGIPGVRFADGPRGVIMDGGTTFPVSMGRGATFDPELEERVGDVIGRELRAMGGNFFGGVCINLLRHPAWGRAQETYGEDPIHLGEFGAALARGVQKHVMACAKHYALNSMENARFSVDVTIAPRPLHEIYLRHFKRAVEEGVASIMSAYNSVNGEWCGQNYGLLTEILKKQWGFQGFVMTDFIFGMRDSRKAALAGQDIEMPFDMIHRQHLKSLVERGEVPVERIDDAALRVLRQQIRFAQGRDPQEYSLDVVGSEAHRMVAREAAEKAIVLLKNEGALLPLKKIEKLAVIGKLAAVPNTGDGGSSNTRPSYVVTPFQGLQEALEGQAEIIYDDGSDPVRAAQVAGEADVVVLVVGYTHLDEGEYVSPDSMAELSKNFPPPTPEEMPIAQAMMANMGATNNVANAMPPGGDRKLLTLHPDDEALIQAVAASNPRTVVAMMGGSAIITENWRGQVPAILMLWYPGMEGGHAFADILLGKVNPSGKLPCVFAARSEDLPDYDMNAKAITYDLWHGYRKLERDGAVPAFPFGFGLSYTAFEFDHLRLSDTSLGARDTLTIALEVTNRGQVAGDTVVQVYVAMPSSQVERAPKELKAFRRVQLKPGETKTVQVDIPVKDLAYYDEQSGWTVEPASYTLIVGQHSLDDRALQAKFRIV
ncbi:MAG TPA: glycoside hydrolase family 3 C-terminal domain-containing protein [Anaerolineales bacterium]|nr:glycoside hydrolase family 3 C-terminal domain-containing protein [Anaerolineales bacterium]